MRDYRHWWRSAGGRGRLIGSRRYRHQGSACECTGAEQGRCFYRISSVQYVHGAPSLPAEIKISRNVAMRQMPELSKTAHIPATAYKSPWLISVMHTGNASWVGSGALGNPLRTYASHPTVSGPLR